MLPRMSSAATPKFGQSAQTDAFNHNHASQMAHVGALKQQAARALQGRPTSSIPRPAGGPTGDPGGAPQVNYKLTLAHAAAQKGMSIGIPHIHAAIDSMASQGKITPFQANALKMHNGPLKGPQGAATMHSIASTIMGAPKVPQMAQPAGGMPTPPGGGLPAGPPMGMPHPPGAV